MTSSIAISDSPLVPTVASKFSLKVQEVTDMKASIQLPLHIRVNEMILIRSVLHYLDSRTVESARVIFI